jgi:predicted ester cyclase
MTREANIALIQRFFEAMNTGRGAGIVDEIFAPTFTLNGYAMHPADFKDLFEWAQTEAPDWRHTVEDVISEGDKVVVRLSTSGTPRQQWRLYKTNGQSFTSKGFFLFRITNGVVVEAWDQFNELEELRQLGAIPRPEQDDDTWIRSAAWSGRFLKRHFWTLSESSGCGEQGILRVTKYNRFFSQQSDVQGGGEQSDQYVPGDHTAGTGASTGRGQFSRRVPLPCKCGGVEWAGNHGVSH